MTLNTPHATIERYSELRGLPIDTIIDMLAACLAITCIKIKSAKK
jgi:hypothetical protein